MTKTATKHYVTNGVCEACGRSGGDLNLPCPGYKTAGEFVKHWKPHAAPAAKKSKKR